MFPTPLLNGDAAQELLRDTGATFDAANLHLLGLYLVHADPDIRSAAREAIVQLGAPEGVALLRNAADQTTEPEEARELRKAAAFLALPSWRDRPLKQPVKPPAAVN